MTTRFKKETVIAYFGSVGAMAKYFDVSRQSVYQLEAGKPIPAKRQLQLALDKPEYFRKQDLRL